MKPDDLPYNIDGYADRYDAEYLENPITIAHTLHELEFINNALEKDTVNSWCDVACGTGWHMRHVETGKKRIAIDRSPQMIAYAQSQIKSDNHIQWVNQDVNQASHHLEKSDLVTHLWYGYIHQVTLDDVHEFFKSLMRLTAQNGDLFFAICDPNYSFEKIKYDNSIVLQNGLFLDALIWRYNDPITNTEYKNCIAPHPDLIHKWVTPYFKTIEKVLYPLSPRSKGWQRYAYHCQFRNNKDI